FHVVHNMRWLAIAADGVYALVAQLVVDHGNHGGIVACLGDVSDQVDTVLVFDFFGTGPGVLHVYADIHHRQFTYDIDNPCIANIGAILFESDTHDKLFRAVDVDAPGEHQAHHFAGDVAPHAVVDASPGQDHFRMIADRLRLVGQ